MSEVYLYVTKDKVEGLVGYGLKLSEYNNRRLLVNGIEKKAISALLNPKDDNEKYNDSNYTCLKLTIDTDSCFVADRLLFIAGSSNEQVMDRYNNSILPLKDYIFGSYRVPECLITTTIIGDNVKVLNKGLDSPILFEDSEDLYINNLLDKKRNDDSMFIDKSLYYYYSFLSSTGKMIKNEDRVNDIAVFTNLEDKEDIIVRIPRD